MLAAKPTISGTDPPAKMMGPVESAEPALRDVRDRIRTLVEIAAANQSTISLGELRALLPKGRFPTDSALERFLATDEGLSTGYSVVAAQVTPRGREDLAWERMSQRQLARDHLELARRFARVLGNACPWIQLAGVSGSTAYGGAKPGDDIDFFLVTDDRRVWISLLITLIIARLERLRSHDSPGYCFNRIAGRRECERAFRENQDPLFAREVLNMVVVRGTDVYGNLLAPARWMKAHFAELYLRRVGESTISSIRPSGLGAFEGRILNTAAYLILGPYLWLAGLKRNVWLRRRGRDKESFRTVIRPEFYATESALYDELREAYRRAFA